MTLCKHHNDSQLLFSTKISPTTTSTLLEPTSKPGAYLYLNTYVICLLYDFVYLHLRA
ncbi:hypothetical protein Lalb_Chr20g0116711 [Lupinus albus]|uniref:Uncharacterized protein n=1 Tax=Lupinus albus TaxID=3870 RepID=A0A6A4NVA8_LUPAL|nr:hypothetical protein Lalb_Chr20g0116711 [Lupinus albus]